MRKRKKRLKLKKSIKVLLIDVLQLYIILKINTISINNLYNTLYFNIILIILIITLEIEKNIID